MNAITEQSASPSQPSDVRSAAHGQGSDDSDLIDIRALLSTLWRRRGVITGVVFLMCVLALLVLFQITPKYTASALLTLDLRQESVVDIEAVISGLSPDASVINTELDVLSSRRLLGKLVDRQNLVNDPEFNGSLRPAGLMSVLLDPGTYLSDGWLTTLGLDDAAAEEMTEEERKAQERGKVLNAVGGALSVSNPGLSYTIRISFETESPKKSAALANALAEIYLNDQLEAKFEATERATTWLNSRIGDLRDRVRAAEMAVQQFREENAIVEASRDGRGDGTVLEQQLVELNTKLSEADADLAAAESRYAQVQAMRSRGNVTALADVLQSPLISRLREQEAEVRRRYAEVTGRYGERHPEVSNARAELSEIQGKIGSEVARIVSGVRNEVEIARSRVATLRASLVRLETASTDTEKARVQLRELEREAQASRTLLETFLNRFKETTSQQDLQQADARIISEADAPVGPSFPNKKLILAVVFVLAVMIGVGLAFLLDLLDHGYRTIDHVQKETGLKGLGMVPRLTKRRLRGASPWDYVVSSPTSAYAESLRAIYTTLMFGRTPAPKSVVITSSVPGEGKTTFCVSLARLLARAGDRTVLYVEADLRRGDVQSMVAKGKRLTMTLDAYLLGEFKAWRECVVRDQKSGLHMLLASGDSRNSQTLLGSDAMATLLTEAKSVYDLILIDTPPVMAVSDAIVLSHMADTTVFVTRWESTARQGVRSAVEALRKANANMAGVVMTQVDIKKHAKYGYGDYASYYGRYGQYYAS